MSGAAPGAPRRFLGLAVVLRIGAFAPLVAGALYFLVFTPSAPTVAVIQATVEAVSFQVSVPEMAQLRLPGYGLSFESPGAQGDLGFKNRTIASATAKKPLCLTGVLVPEPGTTVTYKRHGSGPITIIFERSDGRPAASFEFASGAAPEAARRSSWLRLEAKAASDDDTKAKDKPTCEGEAATRLPLYGVADLGTEIRPVSAGEEPSSGLLLDGTIDIFAQTLELRGLGDGVPRLYPASGGSITIPPGSRVTEYTTGDRPRQPWTGFVALGTDEALSVKVTTGATRLALIRPGLSLRPEVLSIGLFAQLANDPTLVAAQVVAALLFSCLQIAGTGLAWWSGRDAMVHPTAPSPSPGPSSSGRPASLGTSIRQAG
ncbi:MAG: hypothetical protein JO048_14130 [Methylobacteriaceae bacterium]|nr:hypothetical protein [Methylobacteriaceae bacterium]